MIILENYKIIKKIASGGMGDVYLAEHTVLETKVAIKSLHPNLVNDENFRKRFRIEAKTQWKLSHPSIVKLIDFQERKNGLYLIMEYVKGKQLNEYVRDVTGPIPENVLIPLFKDILEAIQHAHSKGLIHRDIKPSNIIITDEGEAKVIDFGIAKSSDEDKGLTKTGVQVGTVSYMSPEQVNAEKLDLLTDIYSLGVMLYQMAVGKAPYSTQTNTFKIQLSIVSEPLPDPKKIYPSISDELVSIIEKATQKKKEDRFKSCNEFIRSFDEIALSKKNTSQKIKKNTKTKDTSIKGTNNRKSPLLFYIIIGFILTATVVFFVQQNNIQEKLEKEKIDMLVKEKLAELEDERLTQLKEDRLAKLEKDRLAKLEKDRLAKLEKDRLANLEKDRLAKLEKDRLEKLRVNKPNNNNSLNTKKYSNGTYTGKIKNDLENGYGTFRWNDGQVYEGYWVDGELTGKGKYTWKNGNIYVGDFINSERTGKGKYTWKESGDVYEGDFINAELTGKGKYTWKESGDIYVGDFINSKRSGKGKYTWKENGDIYVGDFINGELTGKGKYTYKRSGDVYEGDFVNLYFTGNGKYTWSNGDIFIGEFNKDVKGKGTMYFKSSGKREFGEYNKRGKWKKR